MMVDSIADDSKVSMLLLMSYTFEKFLIYSLTMFDQL
jgi:hypothetical protein